MTPTSIPLHQLFWQFFKIGCVAFGGFMALISVIENVVVKKEKWLSSEVVLDGISLANLLPGPQAVNVVVYIGYQCRGSLGAFISAVGVLLPTLLLMIVLTHLYFLYGNMLLLSLFFKGLTPAITALILTVVWRMTKKNIKNPTQAAFAIIACLLIIFFQNIAVNLMIIFCGGLFGYFLFRKYYTAQYNHIPLPVKPLVLSFSLIVFLLTLSFLTLPIAENGLIKLIVTFSSLSITLFGGGYVFIPMIQNIVVDQHHWLTQQAFIDGIAMGQITPGPILISASFIGQKLMTEQYGLYMGIIGAIASAFAIFTPPAILMISATKTLAWLKQSAAMQAAFLGIRCVVIGMIFSAAFTFGFSAIPSPKDVTLATILSVDYGLLLLPSLIIFSLSLISFIKYKLEVVWVIPIAGLLGILLY